jgi:uncharacterized protein YcbK (DUF882 family)
MTALLACRRRFLRRAAFAVALPTVALTARAGPGGDRALSLVHTHTLERLRLVYAIDGRYVIEALGSLDHFLRDHYTGDVGRVHPPLFDLLHRVQGLLGHRDAVEVISGYRSPATNARLRRTGGGGVASRSLHMDGRAIDVRLRGVPLAELRDAALSLQAGGVGYYPREGFVHLDTGRVRRW